MTDRMRLFNRDGIFYVQFERGKKKSLKTGDERVATAIFNEMEKEYLKGRLIQLDNFKKISLKDFRAKYVGEEYAEDGTLVLKGREGTSKETAKMDYKALKYLGRCRRAQYPTPDNLKRKDRDLQALEAPAGRR